MPKAKPSKPTRKRARVAGRSTSGKTPAKAFRLGPIADSQLNDLAEYLTVTESEVIRRLISERHREIFPPEKPPVS